MAAFKFNLQQLDVLGAYDRYTKELEERKKEELYENKLIDQQVDDFNRYYNPKSIRQNDLPLLQGSFTRYKNAAVDLNKARRLGNVDDINKNRDIMQKAVADMGDVYDNSVLAKGIASNLSRLQKMQEEGKIVIDNEKFNNDWGAFTNASLDTIKNKYGNRDTWGNVVTGVEYDNNKFNESLGKTITAFNSNKNNYITSTAPVEYQTQKLETGDEFKIPVFEKTPDYNKALQLAVVQAEPMKRKIFQQFNTELAQGGTIGDIARLKQNKIATIFKKTPDQLTADDLLAYSIAGDTRREADFKQGKATWEMAMSERKQDFNEKMSELKLQLARAKAASQSSKEKEITTKQLNLAIGYYRESRGSWVQPTTGKLLYPQIFDKWLEANPKVRDFINKNAPNTKGNIQESYRALEGYMKEAKSSIAAALAGL
jgi:hypothetical protein